MGGFDIRSKAFQNSIVAAIEAAELDTSGEIRLHLEPKCKEDPIQRAIYVFNKLNMDKTQLKNGVLIYVAYADKKLAIIGDSGINVKVPADFWEEIKKELISDFVANDVQNGLTKAIVAIGKSLKNYFPYSSDDVNEHPNEVSYGE